MAERVAPMHDSRSQDRQIAVVSADAQLIGAASAALRERASAASAWNVELAAGIESCAAVLIDVDTPQGAAELKRIAYQVDGRCPIIVVVSAIEPDLARLLVQLRIADVLVKPVTPAELARSCARAERPETAGSATEAEIFTFLPAAGGVGVTTLAIQTGLILQRSGGAGSTCLVDLNFQQGSCADYLDVEPRLDLDEIEPRPERLDAQLLEVMVSRHASGLAVICAPNRPAEMRSFDPAVVTRLLDLVSTRFRYVVLDMPRTWFAWTDNVLVGSNKSFIVTEATVPGLRHANALIAAVEQRLRGAARPRVLVNRFDQRMFSGGLQRSDIERALAGAFGGAIPNNYALVREAIDRGVPLDEVKPRNEVSAALRAVISPEAGRKLSLGRIASLFRGRALRPAMPSTSS